jgi:hypothetical protein
MPKCSCAGNACSCTIKAGSGVVVEGIGSVNNPFVISVAPTPDTITQDDTGTLDLGQLAPAAVARILLHASPTSVNLPSNGSRLDLLIAQDSVGGRTITWPAAVIWPGGTDPVLTAAANATDWITLVHAGDVWAGVKIGSALT